jgi:cytochrome c peroxidase
MSFSLTTSKTAQFGAIALLSCALLACGGGSSAPTTAPTVVVNTGLSAGAAAKLNLNLNALDNFSGPALPAHYQGLATNTPANNAASDKIATLGRVLFYDKALSVNNTVSCASCHQAGNGFSDDTPLSVGFAAGSTTAHAMRLGNAVFYRGQNGVHTAFWDKRATSLENQATQPIQNAVEMGFSAGIAPLLTKMAATDYYPELFTFAFGTAAITEDRMQKALAQFERAMVSTNSKWDSAYATVFSATAVNQNLQTTLVSAGFTASEDRGRQLFMGQGPGPAGGLNCVSCHAAPSFALTASAGSNGLDAGETRVFKSPSLKNVAQDSAFMHDGRFATLEQVVEHYNSGVQAGPALDVRLLQPGTTVPRRLNLTAADKTALVDFLKTLNDNVLTADTKFSSPFKP